MNVLLKGVKKLLDYDKHNVYTVSIEDKTFYRKLVKEVYDTLNGEGDAIKIYADMEECNTQKMAFVINDLFNMELGGTKINNAILLHLKDRVNKTELRDESDKIIASLTEFFDKVEEVSDYSVSWNDDIDLSQVLKVAGFKITLNENADVLSNTVSYMKILYEVLGIRLFVFINVKVMFEEELLKQFYHQCTLEGYNVLNLDVSPTTSVCDDESVVFLDKDFCEIY